MKRMGLILTTAVLLSVGPAFADSSHNCQGNSCNGGGDPASVNNINQNVNTPTFVQTGGNASATATGGISSATAAGGSANSVNTNTATGGAGGSANQSQEQSQDNDQTNIGEQSTNVSFYSKSKTVRQAPDLGVLPSGPCTGGSGQGTVGAAGFAFGIGIADVDENCSKLETVRVGMASDDPQIRDLAKRVYLSIEWVQDVNPEADGEAPEQHSARAEQTAELPRVFYGSNR